MRCLVYRVTVSVFRSRHFRSNNCHCGNKQESSGQNLELSETTLSSNNVISYKEVYDNPNYSHIMIGGQPFFILPSGELSGHVPVPRSPDTCAVQPRESHVYQHASSTYRSTSDYDTDSSTFRPESDTGFPPIYEEIDKPRAPAPAPEVPRVSQWAVSPHRQLSPRRPNNSMYYYSDTLKRRGGAGAGAECHESDSGVSSR